MSGRLVLRYARAHRYRHAHRSAVLQAYNTQQSTLLVSSQSYGTDNYVGPSGGFDTTGRTTEGILLRLPGGGAMQNDEIAYLCIITD